MLCAAQSNMKLVCMSLKQWFIKRVRRLTQLDTFAVVWKIM